MESSCVEVCVSNTLNCYQKSRSKNYKLYRIPTGAFFLSFYSQTADVEFRLSKNVNGHGVGGNTV